MRAQEIAKNIEGTGEHMARRCRDREVDRKKILSSTTVARQMTIA